MFATHVLGRKRHALAAGLRQQIREFGVERDRMRVDPEPEFAQRTAGAPAPVDDLAQQLFAVRGFDVELAVGGVDVIDPLRRQRFEFVNDRGDGPQRHRRPLGIGLDAMIARKRAAVLREHVAQTAAVVVPAVVDAIRRTGAPPVHGRHLAPQRVAGRTGDGRTDGRAVPEQQPRNGFGGAPRGQCVGEVAQDAFTWPLHAERRLEILQRRVRHRGEAGAAQHDRCAGHAPDRVDDRKMVGQEDPLLLRLDASRVTQRDADQERIVCGEILVEAPALAAKRQVQHVNLEARGLEVRAEDVQRIRGDRRPYEVGVDESDQSGRGNLLSRQWRLRLA